MSPRAVGVWDAGDVRGQLLARLPQVTAAAVGCAGLFEGSHEADRARGTELDDDGVRKSVIAEGVEFSSGERGHETFHERFDGATQRLGDRLVLAQPHAQVLAEQ